MISIFDNHFLVNYEECILDAFEFESGAVIENAKVEYSTSGIPKYDDEGFITNAIVFCPSLKGDRSILKNAHQYLKENGSFDKNEFFFITITPLGAPGSCSPSSTGLKYRFPEFNFKDRVNFKRQFISEKFKINKILGILGEDLGGFETYTWACEYPDDMEFILVFDSAFKTAGIRYAISKGLESIIDLAEGFYEDTYNVSLSNAIVALNKLLFTFSFPRKIIRNMSNKEMDVLMDDYVDEGLFMDVYDFKFRNDSILKYDVEDKLSNIKAKALIIASTNADGYFNLKFDTLPLENLIENSKIVVYDSKVEKYDEFEDYSIIGDEVLSFLEEFKE